MLVEVARRLRGILRDADLIVRWGGEEFLVVVRSLGADAVEALAQRMLDVGRRRTGASTRAGAIASRRRSATPPSRSSRRAWRCRGSGRSTSSTPRMYLAKAHGRNRAYGVRMLQARDESQFDAIAKRSRRPGTPARSLTPLRGPCSEPAPASPLLAEPA